MANPYTTWVKDVRIAAKDAAKVGVINAVYIGLDFVITALETIMNVVSADGVITGTISGATLNASYDDPLNLVNDDPGNESAAVMWIDSTGALRIKVATSTTTPPTPSSETDGDRINVTTDSAGPSF